MTDSVQEESGLLGEEPLLDPAVLLQAISGVGTSNDRVIKRQRRGNRMKVYDNGFVFTYDKDSQDRTRSFWRCERKSECQARVHTNPITNQILKRINEHTHGPPNRDDLPPWLVLSQVPSDTSDDGMTSRRDSITGILINANYSTCANTHLAQIVEKTEDPVEIFKTVKAEPEEEQPIVDISPPKKKKKNTRQDEREPSPVQTEKSNDLAEIAKKILLVVKNSRLLTETTPSTSNCSPDVVEFLEANNLGEYVPRLTKYTMDKLRLLSQADCLTLLDGDADGLLLYSALKSISSNEVASSSSSSSLTIFITETPSSSDDEPLYQMISIQEKTPVELRLEMEQKGLISKEQNYILCVEGPNKIKVALNEKIIASWPSESVFQFSFSKNICLLNRIS